jgi:hypothetical protein
MARAGATCLSLDAGRTLIFDQEMVIALADSAGIAIVAAAADTVAGTSPASGSVR